MKSIKIVGIGSGSIQELTLKAYKTIEDASIVIAFDRVAQLLSEINKNIINVKLSNLVDEIEKLKDEEIVIVLSGDINFYSATNYIQRNLNNEYQIELIPGLSSYQILCAKMNISYEKMQFISLHGLQQEIKIAVAIKEKTFFLLDAKHNVNWVLEELKDIKGLNFYIGENLGMDEERLSRGSYADLKDKEYSVLAVMIIVNENVIDYNRTLYDEDFLRAKVPMTKQEIRWLSLSLLDLKEDDIVYDIGAGSGSISIAMGYKLTKGCVYALEKKEDAFNLIKDNISHLNAYNVYPYHCSALEMINELEVPTKVFIGGSGNDIKDIIKNLLQRNNKIEFVVTCITLETQAQVLSVFKELDFEYDVYSINSARSHKVAQYNMMYANNPITIIKGGQASV